MTENTKIKHGKIVHEYNPFIPTINTRTKRVVNKTGDMMLVNAATGEVETQIAGFWSGKAIDSEKFVKIFVNGVKALKELTNPGTKVFEIMYLEIQKNVGKDTIYMSFSNIDQKITPISRACYFKGLKELIEKEFLAITNKINIYFINPSYMFNGDRLAFVQEYYKNSTKNAFYNSADLPPVPPGQE